MAFDLRKSESDVFRRDIMKPRKGFTLIELLVVVAIIALLLSVIIPSLTHAKEYAKKISCQSNLHQLGISIGTYESNYTFDFRVNEKWYLNDGTGDLPWELDQPKFAESLMDNKMLPDRKAFFCPGVRNLSHEKNYRRNRILAGDVTHYNMADTEYLMKNDSSFTDQPGFWASYGWLWKKEYRPGYVDSVNNVSSGVLYVDPPVESWIMARGMGNTDAQILNNLLNGTAPIEQTVPHCNALMKDLAVLNPANKDADVLQWLWASTTWAGRSYSK